MGLNSINLKDLTFITSICSICLILVPCDVFPVEKIELTLTEAVNLSIKENLLIKDEFTAAKISEADVHSRSGEFDPSIKFNINESFTKRQAVTILPGAEERHVNYGLAFGGKITSGTTYELKWDNGWTKGKGYFLSPYYLSELTLTLTQPVLKGFGRSIQQTSLDVSRNNYNISLLNYNRAVMDIAAQTTKAYWNLSFLRHDHEVAGFSLSLARNLFEEIKHKIEVGVLAPIEIFSAEAETGRREELLLKAKKSMQDAEDQLRVIMNMKDWQAEIIPAEEIVSSTEVGPLQEAIDTAFIMRADYKQAAIERKNKEMLRKYYNNQKHPDLNIYSSMGLNSLNKSYGDTLNGLDSANYYSWQVGLTLNIPIGNNYAEGNFLRAKYDEEKAERAIKKLEQAIIQEVREAWRAIQVLNEAIAASSKSRLASKKRLEAEEEKFKAGMATVNDVLKFQEEYAKALSSEKKTGTDYLKALAELERVKGTLIYQRQQVFE